MKRKNAMERTTPLAKWVLDLRTELGKDGKPATREKFAEMIGSHEQTVTKWENGERLHIGDRHIEKRILALASLDLRENYPDTRVSVLPLLTKPSDSLAKVPADGNARRGDTNAGDALLETELRRREYIIHPAVYADIRATIFRLSGAGPSTAEDARTLIDAMLDLYAAAASRGISR